MPASAAVTADEYDIVSHSDATFSEDAIAEIRNWLQPTDYLGESGEFRRHLSSQTPTTGLWICETDEYRRWHDSPDHGSLWIKGVPGAGKSVIAASIIQHLRATEDCPVLFFFFRNIVAANFLPRALIQDWLAQLLPYSPTLQFALQSRRSTRLDETSDGDLVQLFLDGVSCVPKVYCVADALDEMATDNEAFLDQLNGLAVFRPKSLKLLMTSRPKQHLQRSLRDSSLLHISLQQQLVDADIISYLNHRFDMAATSDAQRQVKQTAIAMVARRSEGLFLYAKLTMDQVEAALLSDESVDISRLEASLPVGLEQTYTGVLAKQREEHGIDVAIQVVMLEAVTHAFRPLRLNELASLVQFTCPNVQLTPAGFKGLVATCCGPLVEILEDETLQVIHHSFTEFLRGDTRNEPESGNVPGFPIINSAEAHKRLAISCLRYLQSGSLLLKDEAATDSVTDPSITFVNPLPSRAIPNDFDTRSEKDATKGTDRFDYREARLLHPFLGYAVGNWATHASQYDVQDEEIFASILNFLNPQDVAFRRWLVIEWGSTSTTRESMEGIPTALHVAAFSGSSQLVLRLLQEGLPVSPTDAQQRTPLHWAAANGHATVASVLIKRGSDPNAVDARGVKPIHLAAKKNHASVVEVLLQAGVEPDTTKTRGNHSRYLPSGALITEGECAILYATQGGHMETIAAMIPYCRGPVLEQLLCECCRFGRAEAVLAIFKQSDVSANAMYRNATALYFACGSANVMCVEALVTRGADTCKISACTPNQTYRGRRVRRGMAMSSLHRLVEEWRPENDRACRAILRILMKANADVNQLNGIRKTPLLTACEQKGTSCIRTLLECGASLKPDSDGRTPLHLVFHRLRDPEAVKLLVGHGCDVNQKDHRGRTPLHAALSPHGEPKNTDALVRCLLELGANPNIPDERGYTAVEEALAGGPKVVKLLLSKCKDSSVREKIWFLLPGTSQEDFVTYLDMLIGEGVDMETRERHGRTLYLCCLEFDGKVRVLRDYGAKTDAVDGSGNNALHIVGAYGWSYLDKASHRDKVKSFIAGGLDPLAANHNGDTLLHLVASRYDSSKERADYVRWLVGLGLPVNGVNNQGRTALHIYLDKGVSSGVQQPPRRFHFLDALSAGAAFDFGIRDKHGLTALHIAAVRSEVDLHVLREAGADMSVLTGDLQSVLHLASRARNTNSLFYLLNQPGVVDVNHKDYFGRTALHYACSSGEPESVAILLKRGADVHSTDLKGYIALHTCAEFSKEQAVWDAWDCRTPWLRGPAADPLRPSLQSWGTDLRPWYERNHSFCKRADRQTFFPGVATTVKLITETSCNVAAVTKDMCTALDIALHTGCKEFVDVIYKDEALFTRATQNLENKERSAEELQRIRQSLKIHMALLLQPTSCLDAIGSDESTRAQLFERLVYYLHLLTPEDAAKAIGEGFDPDRPTPTCHSLLQKLMTDRHLQIAERVPSLVMQYSSFELLCDAIKLSKMKAGRRSQIHSATALQSACQAPQSNMLMVKFLVEKLAVDVNSHSAKLTEDGEEVLDKIVAGGTALHVLATGKYHWQLEAIQYLIDCGARVDAVDEKGQTPLHIAAQSANFMGCSDPGFWTRSAARIFLDHGADPNALDNEGFSPLHKASGSPDILKELLRRGADVSIGVRSPLFLAIRDQNESSLGILLDMGFDLNALDESRSSLEVSYALKEPRKLYALLCAAYSERGHPLEDSVPLLRMLVERGADLYLPLNESETLVHFLFEFPEYQIAQALLQEPCVSRIDFDRRDQRGRTVLMAACRWIGILHGYFQRHRRPKVPSPILKILDLKVDPMLRDNDGKTALHHLLNNPTMPDEVISEFINRPEVASILLAADGDGFKPFHCALRVLRPNICELLLSKGADILEPDPSGQTVLHHVASQCLETYRDPPVEGGVQIELPGDFFDTCIPLWQRFISEGGSINAADKAGNTPLLAYLSARPEAGKLPEGTICHLHYYDRLFGSDSGVDIFATNGEGETALHVITRRETSQYVPEEHDKMLFEAMTGMGLDPLKEDGKGRSALDVASACEKDDIVGLLRRK